LSHGSKKDIKTKEFLRIEGQSLRCGRRPPRAVRARGGWGHGMLSNKVGIKKMVTENGLVLLIPSVECRDLCCSSEYGIRWIRKSRPKIKRS
jgi:hypothetical protein